MCVTGSRQKVVLGIKATAEKRQTTEPEGHQFAMWSEGKKPRPKRLEGVTYSVSTPVGKTFVTINENGGQKPFEVFVNTAKAGSETAAVSEAIGRLISYILRIASPVIPRDRLEEVVRQMAGIGGGRPTGFGAERVLSLPDGVAQTLANYLAETEEGTELEPTASKDQLPMRIGSLCPTAAPRWWWRRRGTGSVTRVGMRSVDRLGHGCRLAM